jgi:hypothetical protein
MKVGLLDAINAKLSPDKQIPLAVFEKLASREIHLLTSAENKTVAEAHAQIIRTTADLAASGDNSPHQLLALQRLADFPARAEIRDNREQLNREKWAHKLDMDNFRKHIATERLELAKKSFALRQAITQARLQSLDPDLYYHDPSSNQWWAEDAAEPTSAPAIQVDPSAQPSANSTPSTPNYGRDVFHPRPTSTSRTDTKSTPATPAGQSNSPTQHSSLNTQHLASSSPSPFSLFPPVQNPFPFFSSLPPEVLANNALYERKRSLGEIKEISAPGELARVDYSNPADRDYFSTREQSGTARFVPDPTRTQWLPGLRSFGPGTAPSPQNPNTSSQPTPSPLVQTPIPTQD